jgi:E3 ubiquitin-protein ligase RGLG
VLSNPQHLEKVYSISPETTLISEQEIEELEIDEDLDKTLVASDYELLAINKVIFVRESSPIIDLKNELIPQEIRELKLFGLNTLNCIFGIDFTISNEENGRLSFNEKSLHSIAPGKSNPYQQVINVLGQTIEKYGLISNLYAYGFGDSVTKDRSVFKLCENLVNFNDILSSYSNVLTNIILGGPTNFAPLIKEAIKIIKTSNKNEYHVLFIIADGQVTNARQTKQAIIEASSYPLSILMIGVGDGPWDMMNEFEKEIIPKCQFANFKFFISNNPVLCKNIFCEILKQYKQIKCY